MKSNEQLQKDLNQAFSANIHELAKDSKGRSQQQIIAIAFSETKSKKQIEWDGKSYFLMIMTQILYSKGAGWCSCTEKDIEVITSKKQCY